MFWDQNSTGFGWFENSSEEVIWRLILGLSAADWFLIVFVVKHIFLNGNYLTLLDWNYTRKHLNPVTA